MSFKKRLIKSLLSLLILSLNTNYLTSDPSQTQTWQKVSEDGEEYEIQCLVPSVIPNLSQRWLDMDSDDKKITGIQIKDSAGSLIEFVKAKDILILAQSGLKFSTTPELYEGKYIHVEDIIKDNGRNYWGPRHTQPWWRSVFIYGNKQYSVNKLKDKGVLHTGLENEKHRADIYKEVFLNAILQPDTRKIREIELLKELEYLLGSGKSVTRTTKIILEGKGIFRLEPTTIQTTLKNWELYKIKASTISILGKLFVGLKLANTSVDIAGDAAQKVYLQVLADAYASDRLDALKRFINENKSKLDPAMVNGFEDAEDFFNNKLIKGYYDNIGFALMEAGAEHAVDLISLAASIVGLFSKAAGKVVLPYLLSWEIIKSTKNSIIEARKLCLAITLQRELFNTGMFERLQKEIRSEPVKDLKNVRDALNLLNINCYLSRSVYKTYKDLYEKNPFYTLADIFYAGRVSELTKRLKQMEDKLFHFWSITSPPYYFTWRAKDTLSTAKRKREYPWLLTKLLARGSAIVGTALSLIIDSSGSMSSNDPRNARIYGGEMALDQGKNHWQFGIVDFDHSSRLIGSGTPQDQNLRASLKRIDSQGRTNIQAGLHDGFRFLEKASGWKKGAILLTDGDHNTPTGNFDYNKYVDIYTQKGWPVYTIGLTGSANAVLLSKIAAMTGGIYFKADTYQDMMGIIDIILSQFKDETLIFHTKGSIRQNQVIEFPFRLDGSVENANMAGTYPGSKVDFSLIDPQNREFNRTDLSKGVQVKEGKVYKIIKVKNPLPGQWKAKVKGIRVDSRSEPFEVKISADTPIKVETREAKPVYKPYEPIKFKINVAGDVDKNSLSYGVKVTPPEGKPESIQMRRGPQVLYRKTEKPGVYYFKVKIKGEKSDKEQFMRESLKHIVVSGTGGEHGVGKIIKMMGGYFEIDLGKEIGLTVGKKIFVFVVSGKAKRKIAEGVIISVSQGKSTVQVTANWDIAAPKKGSRVEIDRKEL
jgi:hypothetical protein